jgi:hypothetical protein
MSIADATVANGLTPSELVLFFADQFAPKGSMTQGKEDLLLGEGNVAVNPLSETLVTVALLWLRQAGAAKLEHRSKKALFGLMTKQIVEVQRAGTPAAAPRPNTLEALLLNALPSHPTEVHTFVYEFLREDMSWPQQFLVDLVKTGVADTGLIRLEKVKKMMIFTSTKAVLGEGAREAIAGRGADGARSLLQAAEQQPELFNALKAEVKKGINARVERSDPSDSSSSFD